MVFNMSEQEWDDVIRVHLKGTFNTTKFAAAHWRALRDETAQNRIINFTSVSGLHGAPGQPNYAAAKMGIVGLTYSTANSLARYGVTVNAVSPGAATRMTESVPDGRRRARPGTPDERSPDNVAPLVAYLASERSGWITGRIVHAAGYDPITVDDVLASRLIAYPFHLLECCLVTHGGGALVITSADRAGDFPKPAVYVLGTGESAEAPMISQMADFTESRAFRLAGQAAFAEAGIGVGDVGHLMIYDAFAHVPIYGLEALGFVGKGEAGAFIADGNTEPGGRLPLNTNGGGLSYTHTGMYGMFAITEAVRQVRGEAAAQVEAPDISVVLGNGGAFATAGVLVEPS